MQLRKYIKKKKCLLDGSMGTYYEQLYQTKEQPEFANKSNPERILNIHKEYLEAGANVIRTNTFASNTHTLHQSIEAVKENIAEAYEIAMEAIAGRDDSFVLCDIGPILCENQDEVEDVKVEYKELVEHFYKLGGRNFLFETMPSMDGLEDAIAFLKKQEDVFLMVHFSVNQFGYSAAGLSLNYLLKETVKIGVDSVGCNCGVGPAHMQQLLSRISIPEGCYFGVLPNAGYPKRAQHRIVFEQNTERYFSKKCAQMMGLGVDYIGGCCGTTPKTIHQLAQDIEFERSADEHRSEAKDASVKKENSKAFWMKKKDSSEKLIAVELAPPFNTDDRVLMDAAHMLKNSGVDVLTFPDSPSGRTRIDPVLMAEKVHRETNIPVMPHICCRDKNAIALRSQFLGAKINDIHNFLVITGDPVNVQSRDCVKSVFQFDSTGLMKVANNVNEEILSEDPISYGGAINQGRKNLDVEIRRVQKKMEAGATFFLTQPVFSLENVERLRRIKEETGARILCGIMPLISYRNAFFMKNEISGIDVPDELLEKYPVNGTKAEGEAVGVAMARQVIEWTTDFVDGYYFSFPFNRVYLLNEILAEK